MRNFLRLFPAILTIHDGAAAAAPAGGSAAEGTQAQAENQLPEPAIRGKKPSGETKPVVLYGKQSSETAPPVAGENKNQPAQGTEKTPEQRQAEFKALINGEFKDEFKSYFQETFDKRFKTERASKEQFDAIKPTIDLLAEKYGITDADPKKITEAVKNDSKLWEDLAEEAGMTVSQYKEYAGMKHENAELRAKTQQADEAEQLQQRWQGWTQQADELKANKYPSFDLKSEILANPDFANLLNAGASVETAYQAIHFNDIVSGVVQTVGKRVEQNVTNRMQAKSARPAEAGLAGTPGIVIKDDPSKMSFKELQEAAREAQRGKAIKF